MTDALLISLPAAAIVRTAPIGAQACGALPMIFDGTPQQLNNAVIEKIYNTSMENLIIKQGENYA